MQRQVEKNKLLPIIELSSVPGEKTVERGKMSECNNMFKLFWKEECNECVHPRPTSTSTSVSDTIRQINIRIIGWFTSLWSTDIPDNNNNNNNNNVRWFSLWIYKWKEMDSLFIWWKDWEDVMIAVERQTETLPINVCCSPRWIHCRVIGDKI
jgi:hypothetical protein